MEVQCLRIFKSRDAFLRRLVSFQVDSFQCSLESQSHSARKYHCKSITISAKEYIQVITFAQFWADRIHIDPYNCLVWRCTAIHQMVCLSSKSHCGLTRITFTTSSSIGRASGKASSESTPKTWIGLAWPCYAFFAKSSQRNVRLV